MLYWTDKSYWGLGLSSHSYITKEDFSERGEVAEWGARFWNTRAMKIYSDQLKAAPEGDWSFLTSLPEAQIEKLAKHQALTDFLHTGLRPLRGFDENALRLKFGDESSHLALTRLTALRESALVTSSRGQWSMTREGRLVANLVFEKLTFLEGEETLRAN